MSEAGARRPTGVEEAQRASAEREARFSASDLAAAEGKTIRDLIDYDLKVLFCGINPGLYTAATGHHFARPGNRFWPALHLGGITPRLLHPSEERELLALGYGITGFVRRATANASSLTTAEYRAGAERIVATVYEYRPRWVCFLAMEGYRKGFQRPKAALGIQEETIGDTRLWVMPNPSGLNAHYQLADFAAMFRALKEEVEKG